MAKTADQYLASLPAAEQQKVRDSLAASGSSVDQWYQAAIDAGDPRAVKASGGGAAEEAEGGIADSSGAAPSSEWLGKRKPTPREARRYYAEQKRSEDFKRYDDRQLAAWITDHWDVAAGGFVGRGGAIIDKPTESGGALDPYGGKGAGSVGGGGGGAGAASTTPASDGLLHADAPEPVDPMADLQRSLEDQFLNRANIFGAADGRNATSGAAPDLTAKPLTGGGLWWGGDANIFGSGQATPTVPPITAASPTASLADIAKPVAPVSNPRPDVRQSGPLIPTSTTPAAPVTTTSPIGATPATGSLQDSLVDKAQRRRQQAMQSGPYSSWINTIPTAGV